MWAALLLFAAIQSLLNAAPRPGADAPSWPAESLASRCPDFGEYGDDVTFCRVTQSGVLGRVGGDEYLFAVYCVDYRQFTVFGSCELPDLLPDLLFSVVLPYVGQETATSLLKNERRRSKPKAGKQAES